MFFRKANHEDLSKLTSYQWLLDLQNCYIIENEQEILGACEINQHHIKAFYVVHHNYIEEFLNMIEEFMFMGTNKITSNNKNFLDFGWQQIDGLIIKEKNPHNPYTMELQKND